MLLLTYLLTYLVCESMILWVSRKATIGVK